MLDQLRVDADPRGLSVIIVATAPHRLEQARALDTAGGRRRCLKKPFDLDALLALAHDLTGPS
ncbi:MAG: hypothetical protein M3450_07035 [Actinomycetota bacterium]|nr:hypothetical protein [Actinomycetota bacterium]